MKKRICLITNWYPTPENPYNGIFFREQAFAVSECFDFLVVHYTETMRIKPEKRIKVSLVKKEENTTEYTASVKVPFRMFLFDTIENIKRKYIHRETIAGIGKYVSNIRKQFTHRMITRVFERYIKEPFDILYCVDAQNEAYYLQCVSEYFHIPYIVSEHAPFPWPGTVINDANKNAIEKANHFLAISNDKIRQLLLQNIKLPPITYIGNLIDEDKLSIKLKKSDIKTFIIVAANSYFKNYDMFISVLNRLTTITKEDFQVMIVGYAANNGYSKDKEKFEKKIKESRFADKAIMIPFVRHENITDVLHRADAFVMTSIQEGQPVSALEAACCGLPIFSTRCGGVEDYVDDTIGRIYPIMDVYGFANGLKDYLEGKIVFDSEHIRQTVIQRFGKKAFCKLFTDTFNRAIKDSDSNRINDS